MPHHEPFQYYPSTRNPHHLRPSPDTPWEIGKSDQANHQYDINDFFAALKAGNLPAVSYLKAPKYQNAHPGNSDPLTEQVFLVNVLNTLQKSPFWHDTAVILNYDDSDGWYDHVSGPIINHSTNNGTTDPSIPGIGGDNNDTNANDSLIPTLPLSTSTTPGECRQNHEFGRMRAEPGRRASGARPVRLWPAPAVHGDLALGQDRTSSITP